MSKRLIRFVRRGTLPPGVTGSPWPRYEHTRNGGYRGRTIPLGLVGLFIGSLNEEPQVERGRLELTERPEEREAVDG